MRVILKYSVIINESNELLWNSRNFKNNYVSHKNVVRFHGSEEEKEGLE